MARKNSESFVILSRIRGTQMISATIQGINKANNRKHITAQNGKLITGEAQRECVNAILRDCREASADDEVYCELDNAKLFCALYHPQKDDIGRRRTALIVWDKDTPMELIQKTLEVMGLEFERFVRLQAEFEAERKARQSGVAKNTLIIVGGVVLCAFVIYLLLKQ